MKLSKRSRRAILLVVIILLALPLFRIVRPSTSNAPDYQCGSAQREAVSIDVRAGESGSEIGDDLMRQGVTKSSSAFFRVAVSDSRSNRIAPGVHSIQRHLCAKEALDQLLDSARISNLLIVNEGSWNSEIKQSLKLIGFSSSEIAKGFDSLAMPAGFSSLEGLLFPAQYSFDTATSVSQILTIMMKRSNSEMKSAGFFTSHEKFTAAQFLIIASLAQAEGDSKDFSKIAQVVRNRLAVGMPLQFDSTVHYIKGSRGSVFLSTESTYLSSPYNTYRHYGLPPAPINNPGYLAMYAATHPEPGPWIYFITVAPRDTRFTDSIAQFNDWKILYKKNLRAGKFGANG